MDVEDFRMTPEDLEKLNKLRAEARADQGGVTPLFDLLEEIDDTLEHAFEPEDVRAMKPSEVFALLRFARKLHSTARWLDATLNRTESSGPVKPIVRNLGVIKDSQHPVIIRMKEEWQKDRERAARICRRGIHEVADLPDGVDAVLVYPSEEE